MSKIMIVDDHPTVRLAVRVILEREGHQIVAEADNGIDAIKLAREAMPDIAIIDIGIPLLDGLDVIGRMRSIGLRIDTLVLTSRPSSLFASRCMNAGASGYINKSDNLEELVSAVKAVAAGYGFFPRDALYDREHNNEKEAFGSLTDREMMVLQAIVRGVKIKDIATTMLLSDKTVSTYKSRIMQKLSVGNNVELVDCARRNGLA
ncbi:response regulator transcription factor [Pseudomonas sp. URMO17WK12:I12]|jgi:two-component system response regulator EvgA|uniref:response regulator transcription factor n=1 Tax=Pseudomonas sp. URMO17WK12:I12 TaxID=1259797 RepID=UPI00047F83C6|nr:response regulator transcription factor [Pseudomonas sp. URMO17WK12:I12]